MRLLGTIPREDAYARSFFQLECERLLRLAWTAQLPPFLRPADVFDPSTIAIGETEFLDHVLHVARGTVNYSLVFGTRPPAMRTGRTWTIESKTLVEEG